MGNVRSATRSLIPWLATGKPVRVAVVGDVILDEYLDGQVNRISPEAPVPVHLVTKTLHGAGGAANAARNIKLAGANVLLTSIVGNDESARVLKALLAKDKIDGKHLYELSDRPTVRKTRITSGGHQIARVDWEKAHPIDQAAQEKILQGLRDETFDALLISDYGKGTLPMSLLSNLLELAVARGVPAVVDPKGRDFSKYLHASLITPNRKEACDALGLDPAGDYTGEELGRRLQRTFGLSNVLVTLGAKGMVLVPKNGDVIEEPSVAREVYDVSGAGDTVVAIMTLCMAAKAPMAEAMHLANTAAGIVVAKWGTQPIHLSELEGAMRARQDERLSRHGTQGKIMDVTALSHVLKDPPSRSRKVVFTNGCFDILHAGHITYLEAARARGDMLVIGVNSDESVKRLEKGRGRPIVPLAHRMRLLAALECVDYVVPYNEDTPYEVIAALVPDILVKGGDWDKNAKLGDKKYIVGSDVVRNAGGVVDTIAYVPGLSTTEIVDKIRGT
jgi:D-beta-D-heptose 7-phosphate kinase/D-beta-D-heptose 1-phosphate adenosyltransferase